jgi:arylsulfatase A-like enzyme
VSGPPLEIIGCVLLSPRRLLSPRSFLSPCCLILTPPHPHTAASFPRGAGLIPTLPPHPDATTSPHCCLIPTLPPHSHAAPASSKSTAALTVRSRWEDESSAHGVTNLSTPTGLDDAAYLAQAFIGFAESRRGEPFLAQLSIHNCHIPYIGSPAAKAACNASQTCRPPEDGVAYTDAELDFYACLNAFDSAVGSVLDALKRLDYYDNTLSRPPHPPRAASDLYT